MHAVVPLGVIGIQKHLDDIHAVVADRSSNVFIHGHAVRADRQAKDVRLPTQLQGLLEVWMEQRFAEPTQDD